MGIDKSNTRSGDFVFIKLLSTVVSNAPVATTRTSALLISLLKSEMSSTFKLNFPAIFSALSFVLLIRVILLFFVCLIRFSQVFLPILPVPKSKIFLLLTSSTLLHIYCTEANETEVAPVDKLVSVLILLLALITNEINLSK